MEVSQSEAQQLLHERPRLAAVQGDNLYAHERLMLSVREFAASVDNYLNPSDPSTQARERRSKTLLGLVFGALVFLVVMVSRARNSDLSSSELCIGHLRLTQANYMQERMCEFTGSTQQDIAAITIYLEARFQEARRPTTPANRVDTRCIVICVGYEDDTSIEYLKAVRDIWPFWLFLYVRAGQREHVAGRLHGIPDTFVKELGDEASAMKLSAEVNRVVAAVADGLAIVAIKHDISPQYNLGGFVEKLNNVRVDAVVWRVPASPACDTSMPGACDSHQLFHWLQAAEIKGLAVYLTSSTLGLMGGNLLPAIEEGPLLRVDGQYFSDAWGAPGTEGFVTFFAVRAPSLLHELIVADRTLCKVSEEVRPMPMRDTGQRRLLASPGMDHARVGHHRAPNATFISLVKNDDTLCDCNHALLSKRVVCPPSA
eukprot:jgi/Mesvir1/2332/Mv19357-RA.1